MKVLSAPLRKKHAKGINRVFIKLEKKKIILFNAISTLLRLIEKIMYNKLVNTFCIL
jgi:hypothetical protein